MSTAFPHLLSPLPIGKVTLRNRIVSTGHDTVLPVDCQVSPALIAYHAARARGGVGLIVLQVSGVHESARYTSHALMATDDSCIPGYRALAEAVHAAGATLFAQLFHPGREIMETADGMQAVAYSASAVPSERFHVMPRALSESEIAALIAGYAAAARRIRAAGLDGVEIVASHGYLPVQFLNPRLNLRTDGYGGNLDGRLRFLREVVAAIRAAVDEDCVVGLRISLDERDSEGLQEDEALQACVALQDQLDYVSLVAGTSASLGGAVHIAPPMAFPAAYLATPAGRFRQALSIPLLLAGRINQPQEAEQLLANGVVDACGMTRALICDPELPNKVARQQPDAIRACIACNQSCIGRFHRGLPISCIQNPLSGRELQFGPLTPASKPRRVMVAGGGPAGMQAAVIAAQRGHQVILYEAAAQLGGQVLLAQQLPDRAEFGGLITNLQYALRAAGVEVVLRRRVERALVQQQAPDVLILACGATQATPRLEVGGSLPVHDSWDVLQGARVGARVVVSDWRADWVGPGLAIRLAEAGHRVMLAVNAPLMGQALPMYVRDQLAARLHQLQVVILPYARLYGVDDHTVYLQHTASEEAMLCEDIDSLVLCQPPQPDDSLRQQLDGLDLEVHAIGDCQTPRTAEEAIYEATRLAWTL